MADLHARSFRILQHLAQTPDPVTVGQLGQQFGVSRRTVRYDLEAIDDWLAERGLPRLIKRPKVGVWVDGFRGAVLNALGGITSKHYISSAEERVRAILLTLLSQAEPVSTASTALQLSVSRVTALRDIGQAARWLEKQGLHLERTSDGYRVRGTEGDFRRAVLDLLLDGTDAADILRMFDSYRRHDSPSDLFRLFRGFDLGFLERCVLAAQEDLGVQFADAAFAGLVIHLAIAVRRLQLGRDIHMPDEQLGALRDTTAFSVAQRLAQKLQERFGVTVPEAEVGYISLHLLGTKVQLAGPAAPADDLAGLIAREAGRILGLPLSQDQDLISGLALHLGPAVHRLLNGMPPIANPLQADIEREYPAVYLAARQACWALHKATGLAVPESEVGYVAIHLGAAVERLSRNIGKQFSNPRVLVVCATGVGTANLLASRLRTEFPQVEIAGVVSRQQARRLPEVDFELIVTTVPVPSMPRPSLRVSPLLPPNDTARVAACLSGPKLAEAPSLGWRLKDGIPADLPVTLAVVDDIMAILDRFAEIMDRDGLHAALLSYVSRLQSGPVNGGKPMLADLITEETINIGVVVSSWEDAVQAAGDLLVRSGGAERSYVEAMIRSIKEIGPYVVLAPGIALAHARPEDGVKKICMSFVQLAAPVSFGAGPNDPVNLVFAFGAINHDSHLSALASLARILGNKEKVEGLRSARKKDKVLAILSSTREEVVKGGSDVNQTPAVSD